MSTKTISVSEFLNLINETLQLIPSKEFLVEGEVSDFRISGERWVSFDLKDEKEEAVLKCFMTVWGLKMQIENGMRVQVSGYPKVYERYGQFKMNVQEVTPVGEGAFQRAYQLLKRKLEVEGLFDLSRKRSLPRFPLRIGLITSKDAAAYGDFLRILNNRWSGVLVEHFNVHVQGKEAVCDILSALSAFSALSITDRPDVLILTRGGGGLEDLHAFNDEQVARAVFASSIPVVCAVGHERDESLCDFVADVRASTPSNAAERVVPSRDEVRFEVEAMTRHMQDRLSDTFQKIHFSLSLAVQGITPVLRRERDRFTHLESSFSQAMQDWHTRLRDKIERSLFFLRQVDPQRVLSRGYSIVRAGQQVVHEVSAIEIGQSVSVQLAAGSFDADVTRIKGKGEQMRLLRPSASQ